MRKKLFSTIFALLLALVISPISVFAASAPADITNANKRIDQIISSLNNGDTKAAAEEYRAYTSNWISIEEGVKKESQEAYREIEDNMGQVSFTFAQHPVSIDKAKNAIIQLKNINQKFIEGKFPHSSSQKTQSGNDGDISELVSLLNQSLSKIKTNDINGAKADIEKFRQSWLNVEGVVLTQSSKVYGDAERDMISSYAMLSSNPPDVKGAKETITGMRDYLSPLVAKTSYNMVDAITILLREGLEALLVVVALLGFLRKSGHEDKKKWIWIGVGSGIGISIVLGTIVNLLFSAGAFGNNNFLIAGWTGVFAAIMLLYMSYWLHSKSSITEWQRYIRTQSTKALATGSLVSLAVLSFLAVFREGTETVLFFIGMASSIKLAELIMGIVIGLLILAVLSYLILKVGLKIPMRPFFLVSSILMFYLCLKFTGMGIHGLQLAGLIPATQAPIPTIEFFAIYSTWESFIPQIILVIVAVIATMINKRKDQTKSNKVNTGGKLNEV
ncbi:FTR1 family protein [Actinomycetes bacterium NPDC127524]